MMIYSTLNIQVDWLALQFVFRTDGKVVRIPGMPPMYDYEYHPQDVGVYALCLPCNSHDCTGTTA